MLPDYMALWKGLLGDHWPEKAGAVPTKEEVELATRLGVSPGTKQGLAWVLFCRTLGATREEINAACGAPQFNAAKELRDRGGADFMKAKRADGVDAYFLGRKGSHPGGPTATPYGGTSIEGQSSQADRIRTFVVDRYIEPARLGSVSRVKVRAGDVHKEMGLQNALPAVCSAIGSALFERQAGAKLVDREGPANSTTTLFTFELGSENGSVSRAEALLRERYGTPIVETEKILAFSLPDGRQLALQRDTTQLSIWLEAMGQNEPPLDSVRKYEAAEGRNSNLPQRLRHQPDRDHAAQGYPKPVLLAKPTEMSSLAALLDWYDGRSLVLDREALERLRTFFVARYPDFLPDAFNGERGSFFEDEDGYKRRLIAAVRTIMAETEGQDAEVLGTRLYAAITGKDVNLLGDFRVLAHLNEVRTRHPGALENAMGRLARDERSVEDAAAAFIDSIWAVLSEGQEASQPYTQTRMLPTLVLALVRPDEEIAIRHRPFQNAGVMLLGKSLFANSPMSREEHGAVLVMSQAIFEIMRDEWHWAPRDLWDVQSFIWVTCQKVIQHATEGAQASTEERVAILPTNLILYGPPGTGKTYSSIEEAVKLCDGPVPRSRTETEARYRDLVNAGQIAFVTFHQSYSYEDFVEGLRPTTETADGDTSRAGFKLEPRPGLFREICSLAQQARTRPPNASFDLSGRSVFKMSLGRDDTVYDAAVAGNYVALGWGRGEDWAGQRFESVEEIRRRAGEIGPDAEGHAINVTQVATFRNRMRIGDLVIVPAGIHGFRAIGQIAGPYRYDPSDDHDYNHRRDVQWLLVLKDPLPVEAIYDGQFTPKACYQLSDQRLKREGLERLLSGSRKKDFSVDQFVLVIDEINRANVSKVFGELITLIEPDKRIGSRRELTVKLPYSGETFGVPDNLHIVGTMNTADRSIALLDTALRRRFTFREIMPDPELLVDASQRSGLDLVRLLREINDRIEYLFDREHQIGHAYFIDCVSRNDVDDVMRHKVIPLISEYFYEDLGKVAQVLGDAEGAARFLESVRLNPPMTGGSEDDSEPRLRWLVKLEFAPDAYAVL